MTHHYSARRPLVANLIKTVELPVAPRHGTAPPSDMPMPLAASPEFAMEDWNCLFEAVIWRLRQAVGTPDASPAAAARLQTTVLECTQSLDQLNNAILPALVQMRARALRPTAFKA